MTFLEFVVTQLLGEPTHNGRQHGESFWDCPACGHSRFHTLPDRPRYRHRVKCYRCGFWGDAHDVLKAVDPGRYGNYSCRLTVLEDWRREFESAGGAVELSQTERRKRQAVAEYKGRVSAAFTVILGVEDFRELPAEYKLVWLATARARCLVSMDDLCKVVLDFWEWCDEGTKRDEVEEYILRQKLRHWKKVGRTKLVRKHAKRREQARRQFKKRTGHEIRKRRGLLTRSELRKRAKKRLAEWKKHPGLWQTERWVWDDYYVYD
jgi:hypothetical protein